MYVLKQLPQCQRRVVAALWLGRYPPLLSFPLVNDMIVAVNNLPNT